MDDWKTRVTQIRSLHPSPVACGQACLVLIYAGTPGGSEIGRRFELVGEELIIGRGADADIQIDRDSVSRRHARLYRQDGNWCICDLQSTNGTYVNDMPIQEHCLRDGELLKIGNAIFKFLSGPSVEAAYYEEIYRMTIMDGLTQCYNKRYFMENLERELARSARYGRPVSLVLFDIDHFKHINDTHGHLTGDYVLRELARRVRARIRKEEIFARYGGEEFAVLLPEATQEAALEFAEQLRRLVEHEAFEFEGDRIQVTISVGVACVAANGHKDIDPATFVKMADENLYRAKRAGRNRVVR
ncbi:MAG: GGDEF domain-containing protein [Myxococcales bacterium]|nr:GGDEF domain-containing protein [Myxococcota bacterium]MDW8283853.1 GGDEF domain-containing protein [Myxococcales bacterium]